MKKLNNKGVTLAELIVSFALVSVSVIYFYQTIYTVKKLYKESSNRTSFLVKESYSYRIIDEIVKGKNDCNSIKAGINNYFSKDDFLDIKAEDISCKINNNDISYVEFKIEGKKEKYYFYKEEN